MRRLTELKVASRLYPSGVGASVCRKIDEALEYTRIVHEIDCIPDPSARRRELDKIGDEILRLNRQVFCSSVANKAFPVPREIGGRWFDEMLWDQQTLESTRQSA